MDDSLDLIYEEAYEYFDRIPTPQLLNSMRKFGNFQLEGDSKTKFEALEDLLFDRHGDLIDRLTKGVVSFDSVDNMRLVKLHHLLGRLYGRNKADEKYSRNHKIESKKLYGRLLTNPNSTDQKDIIRWGRILFNLDGDEDLYVPVRKKNKHNYKNLIIMEYPDSFDRVN